MIAFNQGGPVRLFLFLVTAALFVGCASSQQKARREQREKVVQNSKLYCEFVNGEQYPDMDVALNLQIAQHCDSEKNFSISSYKTPSEISGMMFCCSAIPKSFVPPKTEAPVGKNLKSTKVDKDNKAKGDKDKENDGLE